MRFLFNLVCQDFGPKLILRLKGGQMASFKTTQPSSSANRPPTPRTSCCFGQKYHIPHKFGSSSCHMQDLEKNYLWNIPGCLTYSKEEPFWGRTGSHQIKTHWIVILVILPKTQPSCQAYFEESQDLLLVKWCAWCVSHLSCQCRAWISQDPNYLTPSPKNHEVCWLLTAVALSQQSCFLFILDVEQFMSISLIFQEELRQLRKQKAWNHILPHSVNSQNKQTCCGTVE